MTEDEQRFNRLEVMLRQLSKRQDEISVDLTKLRREMHQLRNKIAGDSTVTAIVEESKSAIPQIEAKHVPYLERKGAVISEGQYNPDQQRRKPKSLFSMPDLSVDLEKFIGENLISKIGILILIIGVAIGTKYSIENNLISPLTRIVLGYVTGIVLLGVGMKLRTKYESYSAVLVSGAMTIMYFITFMAYSFYDLIPQLPAFGIMTLFTIFTVVAALSYNKQVIAVIGLVGAYAVPFLLSNGSGNYTALFGYVALVNAGILILAFKKNWKPLYYSAFVLTWMIFYSWLFLGSRDSAIYQTGLIFATLYFVMFYMMFLAFKLINKEQFERLDILMLVANSFLYYSAGYVLLSGFEAGRDVLGLFTIANAFVHFVVSAVLYKRKLADRNLFYLVSGLVLVFITIAIPVQLDGNWVTLLWIGLGTLLFWIGKSKEIFVYERLAYPLIALAVGSLMEDWSEVYRSYYYDYSTGDYLKPVVNIQFLTSLLFSACLAYIVYLFYNNRSEVSNMKSWYRKIIQYAIPTVFLLVLYKTFQLEISNYWTQLLYSTAVEVPVEGQSYTNKVMNYDFHRFESVWVINYSLLFVSLLSMFCMRYVKCHKVGYVCIGLLVIFSFLSEGLLSLSYLRQSYIDSSSDSVYEHGLVNLWIRYVSYGFVCFALWVLYKFVESNIIEKDLSVPFDILLHVVIIWIVSSEIIHLMDLGQSTQSDKLGVSIFWGVYALALVAYGIWKHKKHLRIGGMALFAVTLLKLFFYDIAHMDTIAKTIVFVSLGVLLLIISFLYNKYKLPVTDDGEMD